MRNKFAKFAALAVCAGFASCSEYDAGIDPVSEYELAYDAAFIKTFGQPAADQDWGFGSKETRAITRGSNAGDGDLNNTIWGDYGAENLTNITDDERQAVLDAIKKKVTGERISEDVVFPWTAYFLQDVISGQNSSWTGAGANGTSSSSYSFEAYSKGNDCRVESQWYTNSHCSADEAANYLQVTNSGHLNNYYLLRDGNQTRINETTLMTDMEYGTYEEMKGKQFRWYINCHENKHWYEYIIVTVNGNYYICFDFGCGLPENDYDGHAGKGAEHNDWDYNDWIMKITPAGDQPDVWDGPSNENKKDWTSKFRIIAEDLSATSSSDFDFNDIVIDVQYSSDETQTRVVLKAAGGTLPLKLERYDNAENLKSLVDIGSVKVDLGYQTTTMFNTTNIDYDHETVLIDPFDGLMSKEEAKNLLKIFVQKDDGAWHELKAKEGEPACKICVNPNFKWCDERQPMEEKYPGFKTWVKTPDYTDWQYYISE